MEFCMLSVQLIKTVYDCPSILACLFDVVCLQAVCDAVATEVTCWQQLQQQQQAVPGLQCLLQQQQQAHDPAMQQQQQPVRVETNAAELAEPSLQQLQQQQSIPLPASLVVPPGDHQLLLTQQQQQQQQPPPPHFAVVQRSLSWLPVFGATTDLITCTACGYR
jgi:hypothetical protein